MNHKFIARICHSMKPIKFAKPKCKCVRRSSFRRHGNVFPFFEWKQLGRGETLKQWHLWRQIPFDTMLTWRPNNTENSPRALWAIRGNSPRTDFRLR
ncbi:hypothetical protein CDAR_100781 [Caerostris darwini]|uniref:Uncharacterized protein n=1 Tax=Caerostris darwini TaxID=1538125 RepID=A0AAV4VU58_9ARAC|nr:hypothetical protein CDAR_100781 [Caerostris darwini]